MELNLLRDDQRTPIGVDTRELRKDDQRKLASLIDELGMDRADFGPPKRTWNEGRTAVFPVIVHRPTDWYFVFAKPRAESLIFALVPGEMPPKFTSIHRPGVTEREDSVSHVEWGGQLDRFSTWLRIVKHEADPTDIWASTQKNVAVDVVFALDAWAPDEPFSAAERKKVSAAWRQIEQAAAREAEANAVPADQLRRIHKRFDVIEAKLDKQSKPDWIRGALYALFGIALQSGLEGLGVTRFLTNAAVTIARTIGLQIPEIKHTEDHPRIGE